ncbi:sigma factor [Microbispora sp. NPDC049125]|uniref:sigma factor n=1 Tax=Microbispora sp. NPDC049125 TaxID=3154929 RepID=UPI0034673201
MPGWPDVGRADDQRLLEALLRGDAHAPAALYDAYGDRLSDYAFGRLRDLDAAADAVHDALVTAREFPGRLKEPARLRAWLYALTRFRCADRRRARSTGTGPTVAMTEAMEELDDPLLAALVFEALDELGGTERDVLELVVRHGLSPAETGSVLGLSSRQASARLGKARDHVENAAAAIALARAGRAHCPDLSALVDSGVGASWQDGPLGTPLRKRLSRHIAACEICTEGRRRHVPAERLLDMVPIAYAPLSLRRRVLDTSLNPDREAARGAIAARGDRFDRRGFPVVPEGRRGLPSAAEGRAESRRESRAESRAEGRRESRAEGRAESRAEGRRALPAVTESRPESRLAAPAASEGRHGLPAFADGHHATPTGSEGRHSAPTAVSSVLADFESRDADSDSGAGSSSGSGSAEGRPRRNRRRPRPLRAAPVMLAAACVFGTAGGLALVSNQAPAGHLETVRTPPADGLALGPSETDPDELTEPEETEPTDGPTDGPADGPADESSQEPEPGGGAGPAASPRAGNARPSATAAPPRPRPAGTRKPTRGPARTPGAASLSAHCPGDLGAAAGDVITLSARNAAIEWTATVSDGMAVSPSRGKLKAGATGRVTLAVVDPGLPGSGTVSFRSAAGSPSCRVSWSGQEGSGDADPEPDPTSEPPRTPPVEAPSASPTP